jgi:hypothetical protein
MTIVAQQNFDRGNIAFELELHRCSMEEGRVVTGTRRRATGTQATRSVMPVSAGRRYGFIPRSLIELSFTVECRRHSLFRHGDLADAVCYRQF